MLYETRSVKISQLTKSFDVSRETIRKDLYDMEEQGLIQKVHGGAILSKANHETDYLNRKNINDSEKRCIAKKAADFVSNGDTIYIDYGTTASYFVNEILAMEDLTIITASLPIAIELSNFTDFEIVLIGGSIRKNEKSLYGPIAHRVLQNLYVDKGFFGIGGVDPEAGLTNFHMGESDISKLMIQHSKMSIMMADYSKFNTVAMNQVASLDDINVLITDDKTDLATLKNLETKVENVFVVTAEGSENVE